jgi:hypothetical protein
MRREVAMKFRPDHAQRLARQNLYFLLGRSGVSSLPWRNRLMEDTG